VNPPVSAFVESTDYVGPVLVLDWIASQNGWRSLAVCAADDGHIIEVEPRYIRADFRYDWNAHIWIDVNGVTEDGEEEPTPDGGEEVP